MSRLIIPLLFALLLWGCSQDQSTQQSAATPQQSATEQAATAEAKAVAEHLLVFFLDPNGGPCRMQNDILTRMSDELDGKVLIRPVQTTVSADRDLFYAYGIRALPTILLADSVGKEIKRLPPGVQGEEAIRGLLNQIPVN